MSGKLTLPYHDRVSTVMSIESFSYEWEHCTVTVRYGYSRNFECFYRNYDTGTVTIRYGKFPTHTKTTLRTFEIPAVTVTCTVHNWYGQFPTHTKIALIDNQASSIRWYIESFSY